MNAEQVKSEVSRQLTGIGQSGFAYLEPVLREALFSSSSVIDWEKIAEVFQQYNPS